MMAKKAKQESQAEQSEKFRRLVQDMVDDGDVDPAKAEAEFERLVGRIASIKPSSQGGQGMI